MIETLKKLMNRIRGESEAKSEWLGLAGALEAAMHDEKQAPEFFLALLEGSIWTISQQGELARFADAEGKPFIPIFSDRELVPAELPPELAPVQMVGKEAFAKARGIAPVVLNAGQPRFKYFGITDVENILDRLVAPFRSAPAATRPSAPLSISKFTDDDWKLIGREPASGSPKGADSPHSVV